LISIISRGTKAYKITARAKQKSIKIKITESVLGIFKRSSLSMTGSSPEEITRAKKRPMNISRAKKRMKMKKQNAKTRHKLPHDISRIFRSIIF
jgi:hypothetical protein